MTNDENVALLRAFLSAGDGALKLGNHTSAEHYYQEALRFANRQLGPSVPETGLSNISLSMFYLDRKSLDEAAKYANAALDIFTQIFGSDHPATGIALHQLAEVCTAQDLLDVAKPIRRRATEILSDHIESFHTPVAIKLPTFSAVTEFEPVYSNQAFGRLKETSNFSSEN